MMGRRGARIPDTLLHAIVAQGPACGLAQGGSIISVTMQGAWVRDFKAARRGVQLMIISC